MSDGIVRWEPFRDLVTLREAMDRLFAESFVRPGAAFPMPFEGPAVDVYQTKDDVIVKAAIPGVKPEDIDISVTGEVLTIKGEFKQEEKVEGAAICARSASSASSAASSACLRR